jgi:hypothetical protein
MKKFLLLVTAANLNGGQAVGHNFGLIYFRVSGKT